MAGHRRSTPPHEPPPSQGPHDHPFLERVFGLMCQNIIVLPGEDFVEQVRRWTSALRRMFALKPRNDREWLLAADVAMQQMFAETCANRPTAGRGSRAQAAELRNERKTRDQTLHAARRRYDLLRDLPSG